MRILKTIMSGIFATGAMCAASFPFVCDFMTAAWFNDKWPWELNDDDMPELEQ